MTQSKTSVPKQPDLSIVIPAYCEERRIGNTLNALALFLKQDQYFRKTCVEVVVVAADAPDRTRDIVMSKWHLFDRFLLLEPGSRVGKGRDVQYGILRASGKVVVFMDADLATPLHHLREFYDACRSGYDVVVATRNLLTYRNNLLRGLFSSFGNTLYRFVGGMQVEDTQCGFKMFSERAAKLCFSKVTILGWGFDLEVLAIAQVNRLSIKSIRVTDWQHMPHSTYTDGVPRIAIRTIRDFSLVMLGRISGRYT